MSWAWVGCSGMVTRVMSWSVKPAAFSRACMARAAFSVPWLCTVLMAISSASMSWASFWFSGGGRAGAAGAAWAAPERAKAASAAAVLRIMGSP